MSWKRNVRAILGAAALSSMGVLGAAGCASAPETRPSQQRLISQADVVLAEMRAENADLDRLIEQSAGYIVFPTVGKGGLLVGGAGGTGVLRYGNARELALGLEVVLADGLGRITAKRRVFVVK